MTSTTTIVKHQQKKPWFFCSAPGFNAETLRAHTQDESNRPVPWPLLSNLRIKVLPDEKPFDVILDVIKAASLDWMQDMQDSFSIEWVSSDADADIRLSFRNDVPNWSCLGAHAAKLDQQQATMNFCFGGWQESKTIYSHAYIARVAAHLFGHAFGLPHAYDESPPVWDSEELTKRYGPDFVKDPKSDRGFSDLTDPLSIMRFDPPQALDSDKDELVQRGMVIDSEARGVLQKYYGKADGVLSWWGLVSEIIAYKDGLVESNSPYRERMITGISRIDLSLDKDFWLETSLEFKLEAGPIQAAGQLRTLWDTFAAPSFKDSRCGVLGFESGDRRVQTGLKEYKDLKASPWERGTTRSVRVNFDVPFQRTPNVVVFISSFNTLKGRWVRVYVAAENVDNNGFTLKMGSWSDTELFNVGASWLAHEPDERTIRSGTYDSGVFRDLARVMSAPVKYSSPMIRKPRYIFRAFSLLDTSGDVPVRLDMDVPDWDESMLQVKFSSWMDESMWWQLKGCFVAVL